MARYRVELSKSAEKALFKLPKAAIQKVVAAIRGLALNPYPAGCRKLAGEANVFRIRVKNYRIIYEVHKREILVVVLKIGHRRDVYR